jgi:hypothetical protein
MQSNNANGSFYLLAVEFFYLHRTLLITIIALLTTALKMKPIKIRVYLKHK